MKEIFVMKFGGTSIKDASAMNNVIDIISSYKNSKNIIVLSACSGITDKLIEITKVSKDNTAKAIKILDSIFKHHLDIINNLIFNNDSKKSAIQRLKKTKNEISELIYGINILNECTDKTYNKIVCQGELLSTFIFYTALKERKFKSILLDSRNYIIKNINLNDYNISFKRVEQLKNYTKIYDFIVMQGFIASDIYGETTLLGRGGSDYSASIIGNAVDAKEIQIWTDVDGVLTTDPKIIKNAKTISNMTFNEVQMLSFYGAKVLHPDTIMPAISKSIPVLVKNTYSPKNFGTKIVANFTNISSRISSIHLNKDCIFIKLYQMELEETIKLKNTLNRLNSQIFFISNNKYQITLIIKYNGYAEELETVLSPYSYEYIAIDLICLCGTDLTKPSDEKNKLIANITEIIKEFNPHSQLYGIVSDSFLLTIEQGKGESCLKKLHKFLFE